MVIEEGKYNIQIVKNEIFKLNSIDNDPSILILNPDNISSSDYYKVLSILIYDGICQKQIALIGNLYGADEGIALLENTDLIILMNTTLVVIDCCTLALKMHKHLSEFGIYFSIDEFCDGYIIYGELDIIKLSRKFEIEWTFSGRDIFITNNDSVPFFIDDEIVYLTDWLGYKYQVNKFGQEIFNCSK